PYGGHGIDRSFLHEVRRRHPIVDLFYDTGLLQRDDPLVVQRLSVDEPSPSDSSNVPASLQQAWSRRNAWWRPR
ncbi:MAG: hypothetical protein KJO76_09770, partial [Gammaproteobacteria bacterium]|nr:hypothetical protein [Gammaproteobacteria bacterium]